MSFFDKLDLKRQPAKQPEKQPAPTEPPKQKWIYFVVTEDDYPDQIEEDCKRIGLYYDIEERDNGEVRIYFYQEDSDRAHEIMTKPRKKPEPKKAGLDSQIGSAQGRAPGRQPAPDYLEKMGLAETEEEPEPEPTDLPPTELENRWSEEVIAAEMEGHSAPAPAEEKPRKKRKTLGRNNQVKIRLTDAEMVQFQRRVKKSGLSQGDFLRSAALTGQIMIQESNPADIVLIDELAMLRAELGRQGGMLKMIIKPNEGQRELAPEEWAELIAAIRYMEHTKDRLAELEVKMTNGDNNSPNK